MSTSNSHQTTVSHNEHVKEILYNGYLYDVTNFIDNHPGGSVIKFYVEDGEDATEAMDQFHYRSRNKIALMLKSFPKRPKDPQTDKKESKVLTRNQQMSKDFKQLFEELIAEGYFEPSIPHVILRCLEPLGLFLICVSVFLFSDSIIQKFLATIVFGFAQSRWGWVQHEGGHGSLTGNKRIDRYLQNLSFCVGIGGSVVWWNSQHNRHHAMPQRVHHDVDLSSLPFVTFHPKEVEGNNNYNKFFVKYQGILYWTVDLFLVAIVWKFFVHPRCQIRKKAYSEMALNALTYIPFLLVHPIWYLLTAYWFAFIYALNFALSHSHLEVTDKPTHWIEYSFTHTANIQPSLWCDWWMGYLNYQIEHHLFPTMPQFRQNEITHRVKALADKYGLPYLVYSYPQACKLAMANLYNVGKSLVK